ncbi:hypothetical protein Tco_0594750 [Tanacetum coccineum]
MEKKHGYYLLGNRKLKDGGEDFRYSDTVRLSGSDKVLNLKNFKKDATLNLFKSTNQERIHPSFHSLSLSSFPYHIKDYLYSSIVDAQENYYCQAKVNAVKDDMRAKVTTVEQILPLEALHVERGWDTKIPQSSGPPIKVGDEVVHKKLGDIMERFATTASSLEAE